MKSNIGLVFVVNSEKAFGRFVKEFAGEEEMKLVLHPHSRGFQQTVAFAQSFVSIVERECEVLKPVGEANPNFLFGTSNQIFGFFSSPPSKKMLFYFFSRRRLPIVSQSVTSAYIVRRAFTDLLSGGAQLGGVLFFILVSSVHC